MSEYLSCMQTARMIGVSQSTVKRMCDENVFPTVRTPGGHRRIPAADVERWVRSHGVEAMPPVRARRRTVQPLTVARVFQYLIDGDSKSLSKELIRCVERGESMATLFDNILAPTMWEVGKQWQSGDLDVFQEHLCSGVLRDALGTLRAKMSAPGDGTSVDLNCPTAIGGSLGSELHDMGSSMIAILLSQEGFQTVSLGAQVPCDSMLAAIDQYSPRIVWVSYTIVSDPELAYQQNARLFERIRRTDSGPTPRLIIGGQALTAEHRRNMKFDFAGDSFAHMVDYTSQVTGQLIG
ncbi:MAG: B12-binding domain-containing protein [Planctomycetota bacterium]